MMNTLLIITLAITLAVAAAALYRLLEKAPEEIPPLFEALAKYVRAAVRAVEQHYQQGHVSAESRKDTAMRLVENFAELDGYMLSSRDMAAAAELIEAACQELRSEAPAA